MQSAVSTSSYAYSQVAMETNPLHSGNLVMSTEEQLLMMPNSEALGCTSMDSHEMALQQQQQQQQHQSMDVYTPLGMQRLGQLYKGNGLGDVNKIGGDGVGNNADAIKLEHNRNNVQQLVESAIR